MTNHHRPQKYPLCTVPSVSVGTNPIQCAPVDDGPWHGMPLGGFGAGCIGRSSRGDFNLWHRWWRAYPPPACQFSVFEQPSGSSSQAYALCTEPPVDGTLRAWQWYPASKGVGEQERTSPTLNTGTYHAVSAQLVCIRRSVSNAAQL